jgi:hypothetical protein
MKTQGAEDVEQRQLRLLVKGQYRLIPKRLHLKRLLDILGMNVLVNCLLYWDFHDDYI